MENTMMMTPKIGDISVSLSHNTTGTKFYVLVRKFKFDTIRQESYWVTQVVRSFNKKQHAIKFAQRYDKEIK